MNDLDPLVADVLDRRYPVPGVTPDWAGVLRHAGMRRRRRTRRLALAALAAVIAVVASGFTLSSSVRGLLGFTHPVLSEARLMVSAPLGDGRVARVWVAPSNENGRCVFVTTDPAGAARTTRPANADGGGACTIGPGAALHGSEPISVTISSALSGTGTLSGWVKPSIGAVAVELRWRGGRSQLTFRSHYFVAPFRQADPPFRHLPFHVVAVDRQGRVVGRLRLPTSWLYHDYKQKVLPKLRAWVRAHPGRHVM